MGRISTYICGSAGPNDQFNPFRATRQDHAPEILFLLNSEPLGLRELSTRLNIDIELAEKVLGDMARIGAVEERNGKWSVSFAIFNRQDIRLMAERTRRPALDLTDKIVEKRREIEEVLARLSCAGQVDMGKLAFAIVRCFILDWGGLEVLNQKGLTLCGKKRQPGDRNYVLLGREEGAEEGLLERVYWGSHRSNFGSKPRRAMVAERKDLSASGYRSRSFLGNQNGRVSPAWLHQPDQQNRIRTNSLLHMGEGI